MSLPPFDQLEVYAAPDGQQLPQRFYLTEEQEKIANWKLSVNGKVLPVHRTHMGIASKVFCGMLAEGVGAEGKDTASNPVPLDGCSLAEALGFLRFCYTWDFIKVPNIVYLAINGHITGVSRLAHEFDCTFFQELSDTAAKAVNSSDLADSHLPSIANMAFELNMDALQVQCYSAVSRKALDIGTTAVEKQGDVVSFVRNLSSSSKLTDAALLTTLLKKTIDGATIRRVLDGEGELPTFTWKVPLAEAGNTQKGQKLTSPNFSWNTKQYYVGFYPKGDRSGDYMSIYLWQNDPPAQAGAKPIHFTLCLINWSNYDESILRGAVHSFSGNTGSGYPEFAKISDAPQFVDNDGNLIFQVVLKEPA